MFPEGVAVVIGGTGGVGRTICEKLVEAGTEVCFTYHNNLCRAEQIVEELSRGGARVACRPLDVRDEQAVAAFFNHVASTYAGLHTVVMATGYDIPQLHISEVSPALWRDVIEQDLNGFFHVVRHSLPLLRAEGGSYVHISSAGLLKWPEKDVLSVAPKAAIESLIQGIAKEEGKYRIRANSVLLGVIETGIFLRLREKGVFDETWCEEVLKGLALKRFGQPEDVAEAVLYLASSRASYVTGQTISVAGGYGV
ncbi:SDR family NAD(P)-dependent oxidoreductase [Luteithermobacter gelatinilyticus]|uniref:SDR family NAD(P)-dependent oxidoreductase n=1 Tax=Luteithermobacter gelatinilyticus TaxID=2582913 RepID=UPI001107111E|nr:SDR family oxidoreductase [Luteithermobacter gelatinilyticus]